MMFKKFIQIYLQINKRRSQLFRRLSKKKSLFLNIPKRQKFIVSVIILSSILFFSEQLFGKGGVYIAVILSIFTDLFLFWAERKDLKNNFSLQVFILPFFYSLSSALFYFLVPARLLTRVGMTSLYALGLYSLFLSENIFIVSSIRTIALLSSARTVSFIVTLLSYFFMANVVFSLHLNILFTLIFIFIFSFPLILHSIWTHTLESSLYSYLQWVLLIAVCLAETAFVLWFWPASPTIIALFLTCLFYILVGISQVWLDKRLFKGIMWEYVWVAVIVFSVFIAFSLRSS
ncbi:MAG: hypothetical protein HY424_03550 [Candidatus Levybacteria bacterium]|nr:hypothetical protein [Candidatus Levybacteria bacterium]